MTPKCFVLRRAGFDTKEVPYPVDVFENNSCRGLLSNLISVYLAVNSKTEIFEKLGRVLLSALIACVTSIK